MKKTTLVLIGLIGFITISTAQIKEYSAWTKAEKKLANTAKDASYLTQDERDVIYLMNLARIDGQKFANTYLNDYVSAKQLSKNNKYVKSLYKDLKNVNDRPVLSSSKGLYKAAKYHAKDMGAKGKIGHTSSDGTPTFTRIKKYAKGGYMSENCAYGYQNPLDIVMQLLIDEGVSSLGHRKNILGENYIAVGVSIQPHKAYGYNCVQDFSDTIE